MTGFWLGRASCAVSTWNEWWVTVASTIWIAICSWRQKHLNRRSRRGTAEPPEETNGGARAAMERSPARVAETPGGGGGGGVCVGGWVGGWVNSLSLFFLLFFLSLSRTSLLRSTHLKVVILAGVLGKSKEAPATKQDGRLPRPLGGNTSTFELWSQIKVRRPRRLPSLGACPPRGVRAGGRAVVSTS